MKIEYRIVDDADQPVDFSKWEEDGDTIPLKMVKVEQTPFTTIFTLKRADA